MMDYEKCYELSGISIPGDTTVGGSYRISLLPVRGTTKYLLDELINNPNYNRTCLIDPEEYPQVVRDFSLYSGFINETLIFRNDDYSESLRMVIAGNNACKYFLMVRFSNPDAYYNFQDPVAVKWASLPSSPAQPVDYSEKMTEFVMSNPHPLFESES